MKCVRCGKNFFFQLSQDGLCNACKKLEKEQEYQEAEMFLNTLTESVKTATAHSVILPNRSEESLRQQKEACDAVLDAIQQWKSIPEFKRAFSASVKQKRSWYEHECFPFTSLSMGKKQFEFDDAEIEKAFEKLRGKVSDIRFKCGAMILKCYDYSEIFFVAGVTFQNGRRERQNILREIKHHTGKYKNDPKIRLERYLYEGEDAVAVYADSEQVGNIEKSKLPWLIEHWEDYFYVSEYDITGGGELYYGMQIRVCFKKTKSEG